MRINELPTPCYVIDEGVLKKNLEILKKVREDTGCRILLAQKAFSCFHEYPLIGQYLDGTTASGLFEARLGWEEMGKENHVFAPAFKNEEIEELCKICGHLVFNSFSQLEKFYPVCQKNQVSVGIRVNPECSTQGEHAIYDPCAPGSRLGTTRSQWDEQMSEEMIALLDGLHFHTLCEQNSNALEQTLQAVTEKFGEFLPRMKWLNLGGGHHITRADYDLDRLEKCIVSMRDRFGLQIYLEPGEAVALNAGTLHTTVLDLMHNSIDIAIVDTSAACHMPDVLEMPYRPPLRNSGKKDEKAFTYRLGGPSCLAGDVIGEYSFDAPLQIGQRLIFDDMAIYTTVKNNTFNGMPLPGIYLEKLNGECVPLAEFGYEDFKMRLGNRALKL